MVTHRQNLIFGQVLINAVSCSLKAKYEMYSIILTCFLVSGDGLRVKKAMSLAIALLSFFSVIGGVLKRRAVWSWTNKMRKTT
jgi:hypothetical protein